MAATAIIHDNIWVDKFRVEDAELAYHQAQANQRTGLVVQVKNEPNPVLQLDGPVGQDLKTMSATNHCGGGDHGGSDLINEIVRARQNIKNTLNDGVGLKVGMGVDNPEFQARLRAVEQENRELKKVTTALQASVAQLTARVNALEKAAGSTTPEQKADEEDDDFDLFGDDDDDEEEVAKLKEERQKEADNKKAKKKVIGKSTVIMDVKPWDDETDLAEMEKCVRSIDMTGLLWGASKVLPIAYGIKKLQISCVVVDDEVSTEDLENLITGFEDFVQSVDIVAFQKI